MRCFVVVRIEALSGVNLIQGASRAIVLSDFVRAAAARSGKLTEAFKRQGCMDREPRGAMRPELFIHRRKVFVGAELFTEAAGSASFGLSSLP